MAAHDAHEVDEPGSDVPPGDLRHLCVVQAALAHLVGRQPDADDIVITHLRPDPLKETEPETHAVGEAPAVLVASDIGER